MKIEKSYPFAPADESEKLALELVNKILVDAALERASDIHLESLRNEAVIRYRVDGAMREVTRHNCESLQSIIRVIKKLANLNPDVDQIPQDGRILIKNEKLGDKLLDFRISTFPSIFGEKLVLRILDPKNVEHTLKEGLPYIGFKGKNLEMLEAMLAKPYGLIIFSGPAGSGKTTTAYAALSRLVNKCNGACNIVSLESPVEYILDGVIQTQVNQEGEFNFANAMRSLMRQDPDIIFLGDVPDQPAAQMVAQAVLTGHLVLTQMSASDTAHTIYNFIEMGVEPYLVSMILEGVITQRLARKICSHCREEVPMNKDLLERLSDCIDNPGDITHFYRGKGCEKCRETGYRGRTALYQVVTRNQELLDFIAGKPGLPEIRQKMQDLGFSSLKKEAVMKAVEGEITMEEAIRVSSWT